MPTIEQSAKVDMSKLAPMKPEAEVGPSSIVADPNTQMSPFMHAAMPVSASTYDSLSRQFYGNSRVPITRLLPLTRVGR